MNDITPCIEPNFTIGYAGTIYHHHDFAFLIEPIHHIAKEFPQIHWDFIGCLPERVQSIPNHHFTPFMPNYTSFLQDLYRRNWRIGLGPLIDAPHNRCKTDNKFREYSACRIAGIYSNIPPYSTNIQNRATGILVENNGQAWFEAMRELICNESFRHKIALQARGWVEEHRSIPVIANLWMKLFHQSLTYKKVNA